MLGNTLHMVDIDTKSVFNLECESVLFPDAKDSFYFSMCRKYVLFSDANETFNHNIRIILYCINKVVIAAQCTATFSRSVVLPQKFRYY